MRNSSTLKNADEKEPRGEVEVLAYSIFAGLDLYSHFESAHYPTLNKVPKTVFT